MTPEISARLQEETPDPNIAKLLTDSLALLRESRSEMSKSYRAWDTHLDTYRSVKNLDPDDRRAKQKKEPVKQVIPLSFAQVNTLVTYLTLLYTQDENVFSLSPTGDEDFPLREVADKVMAREVRNTQFVNVLVQFLLDVARFNLGVLKTEWEEVTMSKPQEPMVELEMVLGEGGVMGLGSPLEVLEEAEIVVKEGNKVWNVSPYNFFYDVRLPLMRWREGQFAADETAYHISELRRLQRKGEMAGVDFVQAYEVDAKSGRKNLRLEGFEKRSKKTDRDFMVCLTQMEIKLVPSDYDLGTGDQEELWLVKIANDQRIVALEKMETPMMDFTYDVGVLSPDQHTELSDSLSGLIDSLQETVSWLFNTRIASVRKNLETQLVVAEQHVNLPDLESRSPFIRIKKNAPLAMGLDKFIQQLKTNDPTSGHMADAEALMRIMQMVSGVNENAMGQFHGGRRSATEARNVASGSSSRMKLVGQTIWHMALAPCGRRMLLNSRQRMTIDTFVRICGELDPEVELLYEEFHRDEWWELVGSEDFFVYDGTSQNEKGYVAQTLQELVVALLSNPEVLVATGLDVTKMIEEIQRLRGVKNINRFKTNAAPSGIPGQLPSGVPGPQPSNPPAATA